MRRVVAAHQALQLGKLADHVGDEIGLGEQRRALALARRRRRACGAMLRARRAAASTRSRLRAELVVIDDARQLRHARVEPLLAVLVEEELGVGEPRAQHALVAVDDRRRVARLEVADDAESG